MSRFHYLIEGHLQCGEHGVFRVPIPPEILLVSSKEIHNVLGSFIEVAQIL